MVPPGTDSPSEVYEIRFKNTHKAFFRNVNNLPLITGDLVAVEGDRGFDVGQISLSGVLATLQMKKRKGRERNDKVKKIYRHATDEDLDSLKKARAREQKTLVRTRAIIRNMKLDMKLSDVEFQADNTKAIFYYIADKRVDFRQLIKVLAEEFRIRVEMKQIGLRYEAGLVGGIGSCGRELCCSTWITDFKSVATAAARYQNLSLNPMKISGQCGRLKCCLNYELDTYLDALQNIPKVSAIDTELGKGILQKTDIFKRTMWFSYAGEHNWVAVDVDLAQKMIEMNKRGKKPASLRALTKEDELIVTKEDSVDFVDTVGQAKLTREPRSKKKRGGKGRGPKGRGGQQRQKGQGGNQEQRARGKGKQQGQKQEGQKQQGKQQGKKQNPRNKQQDQKQQGKQQGRDQNKRQDNRGNNKRNQPQNKNQNKQGGGKKRNPNQRRKGKGPGGGGNNPKNEGPPKQ